MSNRPQIVESSRGVEDELRDFDPTLEHGGGPCKGCGVEQEPWRFSDYCQACVWEKRGAN